MSNAKRRREARDRQRLENGLRPRTSIKMRRQHDKDNEERLVTKTEKAGRDEAVMTRSGLWLPHASPGTGVVKGGK